MKREMPEIIEIPQQQPDRIQKMVFWMALHKKESALSILAVIVIGALLAFWKTPTDRLSEELAAAYKGVEKLSAAQWDLVEVKKLSKLSAQLSKINPELKANLFQKQLLFAQADSQNISLQGFEKGHCRDFSEVSLLLAQGKNDEALSKAIVLQKKLSNDKSLLAQKLIPYNLFRLLQLHEKRGEKAATKEILNSLRGLLSSPDGQDFAASFSKAGVSLSDWIKERETR